MIVRNKIIRMTTVASTMNVILKGQLQFLSKKFDLIGITSDLDRYLNEIVTREKIKVYDVKMARNISFFADIISFFKVIRIFNQEKPQIVHSQTPKAGLLAMLAAWLMRVPVRMHSLVGIPLYYKFKGPKRCVLYVMERLTLYLSNAVYPNSIGLKKFLIENQLCNPDKIYMIGHGSSNGIDLDYFSPSFFDNNVRKTVRKELGFSDNNIVFCFVGRMVKDKGIVELVEAFKNLQKSNQSSIKLLLVGPHRHNDDPLPSAILEEIQTNRGIQYIGLQKDVRQYLFSSDVFVFPSYREGLPNAVMQACAMHLPCIVSDISGCNELVINNVNGLLIKSKDIKCLEESMARFIQNPELIKSLSIKSRQVIAEKYEQKQFWENLQNEYQRLLEKHVFKSQTNQ